ncbi:MAG: hypothetical protein LBS50_02390 [Prevotellaceae bacterium]|jgi:hypothetical protein|nr:hypothetical protein [Prevotellaceae bacterium]
MFVECANIADKKVGVSITIGKQIDDVSNMLLDCCWNYVDYSNYDFTIYDIEKEKVGLQIKALSATLEDGSEFSDIDLSKVEYEPNCQFYVRQKEVYDSCITVIGDTAFNKLMYGSTQTIAIITPISEIVITCDKNFNAEFPQGSNLNSLFTVFFDAPYSTIRNNYQQVEGSYKYE